MVEQLGFFDLQNHLDRLSENRDPCTALIRGTGLRSVGKDLFGDHVLSGIDVNGGCICGCFQAKCPLESFS